MCRPFPLCPAALLFLTLPPHPVSFPVLVPSGVQAPSPHTTHALSPILLSHPLHPPPTNSSSGPSSHLVPPRTTKSCVRPRGHPHHPSGTTLQSAARKKASEKHRGTRARTTATHAEGMRPTGVGPSAKQRHSCRPAMSSTMTRPAVARPSCDTTRPATHTAATVTNAICPDSTFRQAPGSTAGPRRDRGPRRSSSTDRTC
jgi:hypothetical protein